MASIVQEKRRVTQGGIADLIGEVVALARKLPKASPKAAYDQIRHGFEFSADAMRKLADQQIVVLASQRMAAEREAVANGFIPASEEEAEEVPIPQGHEHVPFERTLALALIPWRGTMLWTLSLEGWVDFCAEKRGRIAGDRKKLLAGEAAVAKMKQAGVTRVKDLPPDDVLELDTMVREAWK